MDRLTTKRVAVATATLALLGGGMTLAGCGGDDTYGTAVAASTQAVAATAADGGTAQAPNGIEKLAAADILATSSAAAGAADSVQMKGTITTEGGAVTLDMELGQKAGQGTFAIQGVDVQLRLVNETIYIKASGDGLAKVFGLTGGDSAAGQAVAGFIKTLGTGDKWLMIPGKESIGGIEGFVNKDSLLKDMLAASDKAVVKGSGEVNGIPVVLLDLGEGNGTLAVSSVGKPYPVQFTSPDAGSESGEVTFSNWNAPISVTAPSDVLDLSALSGAGGSGN
jgi:hypothetical protein